MNFVVYSRGFAAALQNSVPAVVLEQFIHPVFGLQQMVVEHPNDAMEIERFITLHDSDSLNIEVGRSGIGNFRRLVKDKDPRIKAMIGVYHVEDAAGLGWYVLLAYAYVPEHYLKWLSISAARSG